MRDTIAETKQFLEQFRGSWPTVAAESGVTHRWIQHFMAGRIVEPSAKKTDQILNYAASLQKRGKKTTAA